MKKIFACVQVQNEADIIESLCRYYCSFCDGILVTDNESSDSTRDISNSLVNEGLPVFVTDIKDIVLDRKIPIPSLRQCHSAIDYYGADIILPIDADEFLVNVDGGNPRAILESLDETVEYHIMRHNYVCPREFDYKTFYPYSTAKYVDLLSPKTVMSKFLIKDKNAYPAPGKHSFCYDDFTPNIVDMKLLCYNHYPVRNTYQFMLKAILNWTLKLTLPYHQDADRRYGQSWHIKEFYEEIKKTGTLSQGTLERLSAYNMSFIPNDNNYKLLEKPFDTSFCYDKITLRYTRLYDNNNFIKLLTTQLERNLRSMPSWRSVNERKMAAEHLGQANETIHNLNAYIETLNKNVLPVRACRFYFDTGKDFNEEETVHFQHEKGKNLFYNKVALPQNIKAVRFDPVEGCGCFLQDLIILDDAGKNIEYKILNGIRSENNGIVFTTTDPQILIGINKTKIKELTVQCNIWLFC
jgi:hypothetical protein